MIKKSVFLVAIIFILIGTACSSSKSNTTQPNSMSTSVALTVQAVKQSQQTPGIVPASVNSQVPATQLPTGQNGQPPAQVTQGKPPTAPTQKSSSPLPTKPKPTQKPGAKQPDTPLWVGDVRYTPDNTVFYGNCSAGEDTFIHVEAGVDPLEKVKEVLLWYDFYTPAGAVNSGRVNMWQLGIGDYAGDIEVAKIAANSVDDLEGSVSFYIEVVDKNNASIHSNSFSLNVMPCGAGVLGPPPVAPEAEIRYFLGPDSATAGDTVTLEWEVWDACKVFLDGKEVNPVDTYVYTIPADEGNIYYFHTLAAWGSTCDDTSEKVATVAFEVKPANSNNGGNGVNPGGVVGNPPSGNSVVRFYNYSSHPVVELLIDGQEVILTETQSFLPNGGYLDVPISPGTHTYAAGAGFWSGGTKYSIYPLQTGSFSDQDGNVDLYDPSIEEIMTNHGQSGYYAGLYWDNTTPHCAAFNFYANGSVDFYIDGNLNDSGSYSLVQRKPSLYAVDFSVVNNAGNEQYIGTYYYSGAMAGMIQMNNGPSGWGMIEYTLNGSCP